MDLQLTGKRAIVTGASQGIGLAIAHALAAEGADVVLAARSEDKLKAAAEQVAARSGRRAIAVPTDVTSDAAVQALVAQAVAELGGVDILVNNAANQRSGRRRRALAGITDEVFWADLNVKVLGYMRFARAVAPRHGRGGLGPDHQRQRPAARSTRSIVGSIRNVSVVGADQEPGRRTGPARGQRHGRPPGRDDDRGERGPFRRPRPGQRNRPVRDRSRGGRRRAFLASPRSVSIDGDAVHVGGGVLGTVNY